MHVNDTHTAFSNANSVSGNVELAVSWNKNLFIVRWDKKMGEKNSYMEKWPEFWYKYPFRWLLHVLLGQYK